MDWDGGGGGGGGAVVLQPREIGFWQKGERSCNVMEVGAGAPKDGWDMEGYGMDMDGYGCLMGMGMALGRCGGFQMFCRPGLVGGCSCGAAGANVTEV